MKYRGKVKWWKNNLGYGFLNTLNNAGEINDKDIFVHYSSIDCKGYKTLEDGQQVEFEIKKTDKGDEAVNVIGL